MRLGDGVDGGAVRRCRRTGSLTGDAIEYRPRRSGPSSEPASLELIEASPTGAADGEALSLEPAAVMATLLAGLRRSMPHIPVAADGGTFVAEPELPVD